jgi:hypothetical protein
MMGCKMVSENSLPSHVHLLPTNLVNISDIHGDSCHKDIPNLEKQHYRKLNLTALAGH